LPRDACEHGRQHDSGGNRQAFSVGHHGRAGREDLSRHVVAREAADAEDAGATRRRLGSYVSSLAWQHVLSGLRVGWSPEQIADRLKTGHRGSVPVKPCRLPRSHHPAYIFELAELVWRRGSGKPTRPSRTSQGWGCWTWLRGRRGLRPVRGGIPASTSLRTVALGLVLCMMPGLALGGTSAGLEIGI